MVSAWPSTATLSLPLLLASPEVFGFIPSRPSPLIEHRGIPHSLGPLISSKLHVLDISKRDGTMLEKTSSESDVQVYDNVFSPVVCEVLRCLAVEGTLRRDSEDTCTFIRPPFNGTALTPLEHAMDSALTALGDSSKVVEYWYRDEHMNLDAHVDIDEIQLEEEGTLRAPHASHVLYLHVKEDLKGKAPTTIFPGERMGWSNANEKDSTYSGVDLVTVPAVLGRVLRFPGTAMHAVPCPADRWLLDEEEVVALRHKEMQEDVEKVVEDVDVDDLEDDDDEYDIERAVLLFNTWPDSGPPPRGVDMDYANEAHTEETRVAEWEQDYGIDAELLRCNSKEKWQKQALRKQENISTQCKGIENIIARVYLMGEQERRIVSEETVRLRVHEGLLRNALNQDTDITILCLEHEQYT